MPLKRLSLFATALITALVLPRAHASNLDLRLGASIGFGGAGVSTIESIDGSSTSVPRSESPGTFSLFADTLVTDRWMIGAEHLRGFRLGPFTSQVSFTGLNARYFFMGAAPAVAGKSDSGTLLVKRYTPYVGLMSGVAEAHISRNEGLAPTSSGSGVYFGLKLGVDYPLAPGWGMRPELNTSSTLISSTSNAPKLEEFSLQVGFYFYF